MEGVGQQLTSVGGWGQAQAVLLGARSGGSEDRLSSLCRGRNEDFTVFFLTREESP